jgi:hypothetical protein
MSTGPKNRQCLSEQRMCWINNGRVISSKLIDHVGILSFSREIEADAVVAQHFEGRAAAISKHKQGPGERIFRQLAFAKRGKPIDAVTEVDGLAGKQNPELRDELDHRDFKSAGNQRRVG